MNRMNGIRKAPGNVTNGMHTQYFIPLAMEDMRHIAGGIAVDRAGELPTLPPVRNKEDYDPFSLRTEETTGPHVQPPGLAIAEMMRNR